MANKVDIINDPNILRAVSKDLDKPIFISAENHLNIGELELIIEKHIESQQDEDELEIPYAKLSIIDSVYKNVNVIERKNNYENVILKVRGKKENILKIRKKIEKYS